LEDSHDPGYNAFLYMITQSYPIEMNGIVPQLFGINLPEEEEKGNRGV
jgi:hypothetical protein